MRLFGIDCEDYFVVLRSWQLVAICAVILCCAFMAYLFESRWSFWAGMAGTIAGTLVPLPKSYPLVRSVEGAVLYRINEQFSHTLVCSFFGMIIAMALYARWRRGCWIASEAEPQNSNGANPNEKESDALNLKDDVS